jgi:hypothetical protein
MARGTIPVISIIIANFDAVKQYDDAGLYRHLVMTCRLSRKRIIPKTVHFNSYRVSRIEHAVTLHLLVDTREMARVSFVVAPDFSRIGSGANLANSGTTDPLAMQCRSYRVLFNEGYKIQAQGFWASLPLPHDNQRRTAIRRIPQPGSVLHASWALTAHDLRW